jgi:peptidoglycan hydrolase CwlO-like protein
MKKIVIMAFLVVLTLSVYGYGESLFDTPAAAATPAASDGLQMRMQDNFTMQRPDQSVNASISDIYNKIDALQQSNEALRSRVSGQETRITELESQVKTLQEKKESDSNK